MGSWEGTCRFCYDNMWIRFECKDCGANICEDCEDYVFECEVCGANICEDCTIDYIKNRKCEECSK